MTIPSTSTGCEHPCPTMILERGMPPIYIPIRMYAQTNGEEIDIMRKVSSMQAALTHKSLRE